MCNFWQPLQADSQLKSSGLVLGRRPLDAILHTSNEPGEFSQWLCHDDSAINIVLVIILLLLSASLYFSKEALIEIGCVVTSLVVTRVHCGQTPQTVHPRPIVTMEH